MVSGTDVSPSAEANDFELLRCFGSARVHLLQAASVKGEV